MSDDDQRPASDAAGGRDDVGGGFPVAHDPATGRRDESGPIVKIPLRNIRGEVIALAIIDAADAPLAEGRRWCRSAGGYAVTRDGAGRATYLHRAILGLGPWARGGPEGDHANHNRLDNRRSNLRIVTHQENQQNRASVPGSSSRYRGVSWDARRQCWRAQVMAGGRYHYGGGFALEEDAAVAAAALRKAHMPGSDEARDVA